MTVETAVDVSQHTQGATAGRVPVIPHGPGQNGRPVRVDPDLDFIRSLNQRSGGTLKKCYQCGTCSATCALSPDLLAFPRKEMAWAAWGMRDRLLNDPDVWLCFQCNDCSRRCPRGARPGDVLALLRQESIIYHAFPRFFGRWVSQPSSIPILLGIPAALLTLALFLKDPIQNALGLSVPMGQRLVFAYSSVFPHWLLNGFFLTFTALVLLLMAGGIVRLWRAMAAACKTNGSTRAVKGLLPSAFSALKGVVVHDKFDQCTESHSRYWSHLAVFFGFMALSLVTLWVITAPYNPLITDTFIYPFAFSSPWKLLANLGGAAVLAGCLLMIWDRFREDKRTVASTFFDWALIGTLLAVVLSGFMTEVLHYVRLEPHRHLAYFVHLVFVGALLLYLPYSKFAHIIYRTAALICAEYYGRNGTAAHAMPVPKSNV